MTTTTDNSATCTIFDKVSKDNVTTYTYARKASDVIVYIHDSKGNIIDTKHPDSNGVLSIDKYPLEANSYITVIDSPSDSDPFYKALSIQKSILSRNLYKLKTSSWWLLFRGYYTCASEGLYLGFYFKRTG